MIGLKYITVMELLQPGRAYVPDADRMVYMYHAQDRTMGVPGTAINKKRGGTHNSVTRIYLKATHMIGGYSQLSYGFNYYGPTGSQRDTMTIDPTIKGGRLA